MPNIDYIRNLKNQSQKKKSVTITIDEPVFEKLSEIADELETSRNQIISDISSRFVDDYFKAENPNYYIFNSNNTYMPEGHLHMLLGNKVSAWGDTKSTIERLVPGDYVFVYLNKVGIVGAGTVTTDYQINDYSLVRLNDEADGSSRFEVWDEYSVSVSYDKKCLQESVDGQGRVIDEQKVVTATEINHQITRQPLNKTRVCLNSEEGKKLKDLFLAK